LMRGFFYFLAMLPIEKMVTSMLLGWYKWLLLIKLVTSRLVIMSH